MQLNELDVDFGDEYITELNFTPSAITLAIPELGSCLLAIAGVIFMTSVRRRK